MSLGSSSLLCGIAQHQPQDPRSCMLPPPPLFCSTKSSQVLWISRQLRIFTLFLVVYLTSSQWSPVTPAVRDSLSRGSQSTSDGLGSISRRTILASTLSFKCFVLWQFNSKDSLSMSIGISTWTCPGTDLEICSLKGAQKPPGVFGEQDQSSPPPPHPFLH